MTALDKFIRLEAIGLWRTSTDSPPKEVVVSFGDATLQLTSLNDTPLTHWALRAVKRIGSKGSAIIYSTDSDADETLQIDDPDMIRAITAVTYKAGQKDRPKPRLKKYFWLAAAFLLIAALSQSAPLIYSWALKLTSPARLSAFSNTIGDQIAQNNNFACQDNRAAEALANFTTALGLDNPAEILVVNKNALAGFSLPNGEIYLSYQSISQAPDPESLAALIVIHSIMAQRRALLLQVFAQNGPIASLRHIFGQDIAAKLPKEAPRPTADDFVAARDHFTKMRISTAALQDMAASSGFGLPIDQSASFAPFETQAFAAIQTFCSP